MLLYNYMKWDVQPPKAGHSKILSAGSLTTICSCHDCQKLKPSWYNSIGFTLLTWYALGDDSHPELPNIFKHTSLWSQHCPNHDMTPRQKAKSVNNFSVSISIVEILHRKCNCFLVSWLTAKVLISLSWHYHSPLRNTHGHKFGVFLFFKTASAAKKTWATPSHRSQGMGFYCSTQRKGTSPNLWIRTCDRLHPIDSKFQRPANRVIIETTWYETLPGSNICYIATCPSTVTSPYSVYIYIIL